MEHNDMTNDQSIMLLEAIQIIIELSKDKAQALAHIQRIQASTQKELIAKLSTEPR